MIEVLSLNKAYKNINILENINFKANKGEIVGIIGSSGCGKSTFLRTLNGLEKINSGEIIIDGIKLSSKKNIIEARKKIGIVFQKYNLFEHLNVIDNITLAPIKVRKVKKKDAIDLANNLLKKVKLESHINHYPCELSGGQSQRIAIARCLAMKPEILLLDEITSALDPEMTYEVLEVLCDLKKEALTMVIVSHELKFLREICTKIIFMHNKTIWEENCAKSFFHTPKTKEAQDFLSHIEL